VRRDRPNELILDESLVLPGALVGTLAATLVFLEGDYVGTSARTRFVGLPKSAAGEPRTLAVTPPSENSFNPRVQLIAVERNSLFYGFQTGDKQVIEEVECPASL
jgi:hypothetical protein